MVSRGGFVAVLSLYKTLLGASPSLHTPQHLSAALGQQTTLTPRHDGPGQGGCQQYGLPSSGSDLWTIV